MAALSTLRSYVRDELGELTAGQWSDAQINAWLNRGVDYCVAEFHRNKCWPLLRELTKYRTMTIATTATEYTMFDVIDNTTANIANTNHWYGWVHGMLGDYVLHQETIKGYHKLDATTGEHAPSTTEPWIVFNGSDRGTDRMAYTGGGTGIPTKDSILLGETSAATCRVAFTPEPATGAWADGDATGNIYVHTDVGTFQSEEISIQFPNTVVSVTGQLTCSAALTAELHTNSPLFTIYPALTTATDLKAWFLVQPTVMSAATDLPDVTYDCDELLVLYAAARGWKAVQRFEMHAAFWQEFMQELAKKVQDYSQVTFKSL